MQRNYLISLTLSLLFLFAPLAVVYFYNRVETEYVHAIVVAKSKTQNLYTLVTTKGIVDVTPDEYNRYQEGMIVTVKCEYKNDVFQRLELARPRKSD